MGFTHSHISTTAVQELTRQMLAMSRVHKLCERVKRREASHSNYFPHDDEVCRAAKADVEAGLRMSKTLDRLETLYNLCQREVPDELIREVVRMNRPDTTRGDADTAVPAASGATAPTALDNGGAPLTPAKQREGKPSTYTPQQSKRARSAAAASAGDTQPKRARTAAAAAAAGDGSNTQPKAAPLQLSEPPFVHELLACQAAMGFGTHAGDGGDLCAQEQSAYQALMPHGKYKGKPLASIPDDYYNWMNNKAGNYWTTESHTPDPKKVHLLMDLILVGRVEVLPCPWGNDVLVVETTVEGSGGGGSSGSGGGGGGGGGGSSGGGSGSSSSSSKERNLVASYLARTMCSQPPQTFDPPTPQKLIDRQAAMCFGAHATSTKLCKEEAKAYKETMGFGRYRSVLRSRVEEGYLNWMNDRERGFWDATERKLQLLRGLLLVGRVRVAWHTEDEGRLVVRAMQSDRAAAAGGSGGSCGGGSDGASGATNSWRRMELATRLAIAVVNQQEGAVPMEERPRGQEPIVDAGWFGGWEVREVPASYVTHKCGKWNKDKESLLEDKKLLEALLAMKRVQRVGGVLVPTGVPAKRRPNWEFEEGNAVQRGVKAD